MPGLVRDWGRIKGKPTQYLFNNHTKNSWSGKTVHKFASHRSGREGIGKVGTHSDLLYIRVDLPTVVSLVCFVDGFQKTFALAVRVEHAYQVK